MVTRFSESLQRGDPLARELLSDGALVRENQRILNDWSQEVHGQIGLLGAFGLLCKRSDFGEGGRLRSDTETAARRWGS